MDSRNDACTSASYRRYRWSAVAVTPRFCHDISSPTPISHDTSPVFGSTASAGSGEVRSARRTASTTVGNAVSEYGSSGELNQVRYTSMRGRKFFHPAGVFRPVFRGIACRSSDPFDGQMEAIGCGSSFGSGGVITASSRSISAGPGMASPFSWDWNQVWTVTIDTSPHPFERDEERLDAFDEVFRRARALHGPTAGRVDRRRCRAASECLGRADQCGSPPDLVRHR